MVEYITGNNSVKSFLIWTSGAGGDANLRHFLSRALAAPLFSGLKPFVQFGRRYHEDQFSEIILNNDKWFRRLCRLN